MSEISSGRGQSWAESLAQSDLPEVPQEATEMDVVEAESYMGDKALPFETVIKQLVASHREECRKLCKFLEDDLDRWRAKARHLEASLARTGSIPNAAASVSVEVQVQTDDCSEGFANHSSPLQVHETAISAVMEESSKFVNIMRHSVNRSDTAIVPDGAGPIHFLRKSIKKVLDWPYFDFTMGIVIFVNSITIGVQSNFSIDEQAHQQELRVLAICDYIFLAIYVIELAFRLIGIGREVLENPWIQFDVVLVTLGIVSVILSAAMAIAQKAVGTDVRDFVQNMTLLRILRLCRMVRAVRMLGRWKTLWKLVKGILNGLETMVSTLVMILFTLFVFACFGVELVSRSPELKHHHLTEKLVQDRFNSLMNIFLTLLQFVLVDGVSDIYYPMIMVKPLLSVYFGALVTFLSLMLANLVTAVLVEDAINNAQMDAKMEENVRRRLFEQFEPKFRKAFQLLDTDEDGHVLMSEFLGFNFSNIDELDQLAQHLRPEVIEELYDVLDDDDSGSITENEFINGMMQLALSDVDLELAQIKGLAKQSKRSLKKIMSVLDKKTIVGVNTQQGTDSTTESF